MKHKKVYAFLLFSFYLLVLFTLMFYERDQQNYYDYNIVPFKVINLWIDLIKNNRYYLFYAIENLIGNIVIFIPLGMFIPYLFPKHENFLLFIFTVIISISLVELIQFVTRYGTGDIDDVILNTTGAIIGYIIYMIIVFNKKRKERH